MGRRVGGREEGPKSMLGYEVLKCKRVCWEGTPGPRVLWTLCSLNAVREGASSTKTGQKMDTSGEWANPSHSGSPASLIVTTLGTRYFGPQSFPWDFLFL
jgi:hypothetical protein